MPRSLWASERDGRSWSRGTGEVYPRRPGRAVVAPALLLAALVLAGGGCRARLTDEEQVRQLFAEAAQAAEERRPGDVVARVSERFQGEGLDRRGLKQLVTFHALRGDWNAVARLGSRVTVEGNRAEATVDVALARGGRGPSLADRLPAGASVYRVDAVLEREGGRWAVTSARWRPISADEALEGPR
jgi:hypothetical protein